MATTRNYCEVKKGGAFVMTIIRKFSVLVGMAERFPEQYTKGKSYPVLAIDGEEFLIADNDGNPTWVDSGDCQVTNIER